VQKVRKLEEFWTDFLGNPRDPEKGGGYFGRKPKKGSHRKTFIRIRSKMPHIIKKNVFFSDYLARIRAILTPPNLPPSDLKKKTLSETPPLRNAPHIFTPQKVALLELLDIY